MSDPEFTLLGDATWLDFVNTVRGRQVPPPDLLPDPAAYHRWAKAQKLISDVDEIPFDQILGFRAQLVALAEALSGGRPPPSASIGAINSMLERETGQERLVRSEGHWRLRFAPARPPTTLECVARAAAATLVDRAQTVRRCAGEPCSLFFLDSSPTQSRRWCSPALCGGRGRIERRRGLLR
jgi:predicted RNA-binding Zn ribbon-like protein